MKKDKNQHVWRVFLMNPLNQRIKKTQDKLKLLQDLFTLYQNDKRITKNFDVEDTEEYR